MEHHHLENQHMDVPDFDPNFEPQCRARSYTWPSRPREAVKEDDNRSTPTSREGDTPVDQGAVNNLNKENLGLKAKTSSRRNAWGNLSYADLITKAIDSSPEKRLTLSQIYDWMVQNVSYFKDKGDTNSSAGWKNSIRHNLSLHSRFMRIQNEGTGKSSWWVLNPDAKPGKTPRRRATSMDTKAFEKKRGRVKKKLEQLRALGSGADQSPTTGSDYGDGELGCLDPFSLSPQDFRARTSSNASSIGGRLSPIQSLYEPDLHDSQVPPMSPIPWSQTSNYNNVEGPGFTETLSESLAEMFVGESMTSSSGDPLAKGRSSLSTPSPLQRQPSPSSYLPAPPPYSDQLRPSPRQMSPNSSLMMDNSPLDSGHGQGLDSYNPSSSTLSPMNIGTSMGNTDLCLQDSYVSQTLSELLQDSPPSSMQHSPQAGQSQHYNISMDKSKYHSLNGDNMLSGSSQNTQQQPQGSMSSLLRSTLTEKQQLARSQLQAMLQNQQQRQILQARLKQLRQQQMLRQQQQQLQQEQLKQQQMMRLQQQQQQQQQQLSHPPSQMSPGQQQPHGMIAGGQGTLQPHLMAGGMVQQVSSTTSPPFTMDSSMDTPMEMPTDLELVTISEGTSEDLQCDVDQIINHELSMDGLLDFNFDTGGSGGPIQT